MLLDSFNLSEQNANKLAQNQQHPSQIVIRLLVEIINSLTIIKNEQIKDHVINACVRYFFSIQLDQREDFVQRIALQLEKLASENEIVEEAVGVIIQLLSRMVTHEQAIEQQEISVLITNDFCERLLNIILTGYAQGNLSKRNQVQKRRQELKKGALPLTCAQIRDFLGILRDLLYAKCNLHSSKGAAGMKQSCIANMRLTNRVCQVILYTRDTALSTGEVQESAS